MGLIKKITDIVDGILLAFKFDNPIEFLINWHVLRRRDPVVLRHHGFEICIDSQGSDYYAAIEVLVNGIYDEAIDCASKNKSTFNYLNLGAHIGTFDIRVAELVPCVSNGLAVELNPITHARLLLNLSRNRLTCVQTLNAGAWDSTENTRIQDCKRGTDECCLGVAAGEGRMVPLLTWREIVDCFGDGKKIDLVKIDIEGSESRFIKGFGDYAAKFVHWMVIETHSSADFIAVESFLAQAGFKEVKIKVNKNLIRLLLAVNQKLNMSF